jgi:hypothetical protein
MAAAQEAPNAQLKKQQQQAEAVIPPLPANVIKGQTATYRGVVPHAVKLRNPLQLINPFAPMEHGSGEKNVTPPMPGEKALEHKASSLTAISVDF